VKTLILALFAFFNPKAVIDTAVINGLVEVSSEVSKEELSLLITYAWLESQGQTNPLPLSWDARAGISCGAWQERCTFVRTASVANQARYWIREYRAVGLASLDSSKKRAEGRAKIAKSALQHVEMERIGE
jgi:hypothetical protein